MHLHCFNGKYTKMTYKTLKALALRKAADVLYHVSARMHVTAERIHMKAIRIEACR